MNPAIVITGIGAACHQALDTAELWDRLAAAEPGWKVDAPFDTASFRCRLNAITDPAEARAALKVRAPWLAAQLPAGAARSLPFGLLAGIEALTMAGIDPDLIPVGMVIGTTSGNDMDGFAADDDADSDAAAIDSVLAQTARLLGASGPRAQISNACTSGAVAIIHAAGMLMAGRARAVLAGGIDHARAADFAGFNAIRAMSPTALCAFDRDRDGMMIGDGAAFLLMEREGDALRRGAHILARLDGFGLTCDAFHATRPQPQGMTRAVRAALAMSSANGDAEKIKAEVGYVNCHGTGTPANDATEAEALAAVFEDAATRPVLSSTKTTTGHLLGTAAAIEAVITVLIMNKGLVPRMAGSTEPDPAVAFPMAMGRDVQLRPGSRALSTTLGFGGINACLSFSSTGAGGRQ